MGRRVEYEDLSTDQKIMIDHIKEFSCVGRHCYGEGSDKFSRVVCPYRGWCADSLYDETKASFEAKRESEKNGKIAITEDVTNDETLVDMAYNFTPNDCIECRACEGTGDACHKCGGDCFDGPNKLCTHAGADITLCEECDGLGYVSKDYYEPVAKATSNFNAPDFVIQPEGGRKQTHVNGEPKPMWDLFDPDFHMDIVKVLTQPIASGKYEADNWKKVGKVHYLRSMESHVQAMKRGEILDSESGLPHSAHAACNMMFMHWFDRQEVKDETV